MNVPSKSSTKMKVHFILPVSIGKPFSLLQTIEDVHFGLVNVCDALSYLLDDIYIRFGNKLYRHIVGIPIGTNCAPLVADLFLFSYERDFMTSLPTDNQTNIIEAFNLIPRYLDDLLNIDNLYFEGMVNQIYTPELKLNKAKKIYGRLRECHNYTGLPRGREKSGKLKFFQGQGIVSEFCKLSGKFRSIVKCQGIVRGF